MSFLIGAIKVIFLLGFLILIHEGAHFLVAKKCKIAIREFSIGFGPKILSKTKDNIKYSVRAIPLGGFVDMYDEGKDLNGKTAFMNSSKPKRFAVTIAGIIVNVFFGFLVYFILSTTTQNISNTIDYVEPESSVALQELKSGDIIKEINGQKIHLKSQIDMAIVASAKDSAELKIERNGETLTVTIPIKKVVDEETGNVSYRLGVYMKRAENNIPSKLYYSFWKTAYFAESLGNSVLELFKGNVTPNDMVGPVGISEMIVETNGIYEFFYLMALISISLGITNLLPIPGLDGGRLLLIILEAIRRKPLKTETEAQIQLLGFSFLIMLSLYVTFNDVIRIF